MPLQSEPSVAALRFVRCFRIVVLVILPGAEAVQLQLLRESESADQRSSAPSLLHAKGFALSGSSWRNSDRKWVAILTKEESCDGAYDPATDAEYESSSTTKSVPPKSSGSGGKTVKEKECGLFVVTKKFNRNQALPPELLESAVKIKLQKADLSDEAWNALLKKLYGQATGWTTGGNLRKMLQKVQNDVSYSEHLKFVSRQLEGYITTAYQGETVGIHVVVKEVGN